MVRFLYGTKAFEECKGRLLISHGKPCNGSKLRLTFATAMNRALGFKITFNDYRHCAVTFGRWHMVLDKAKSTNDSYFDFQAGHSTLTAAQEYGRSNLDHSILDAIAADRFHQISTKWQKLICKCTIHP